MKTTLLCLILSAIATGTLTAQNADSLRVGDLAPDFTLLYATKDSVARTPLTLSKIIGSSALVLAFYPADWSSGCTKEVCSFRDDFTDLEELNAEILAISGDYVYSHHAWARHHGLPFRLLSDHFHTAARAYSSFNEKSGMNRRTMFVIDKDGRIAYADYQYNVADDEDFQRLKRALADLH